MTQFSSTRSQRQAMTICALHVLRALALSAIPTHALMLANIPRRRKVAKMVVCATTVTCAFGSQPDQKRAANRSQARCLEECGGDLHTFQTSAVLGGNDSCMCLHFDRIRQWSACAAARLVSPTTSQFVFTI